MKQPPYMIVALSYNVLQTSFSKIEDQIVHNLVCMEYMIPIKYPMEITLLIFEQPGPWKNFILYKTVQRSCTRST